MAEVLDFPPDLLEKVEEVKRIRQEVVEEYMQTGKLNDTKFARIHVLLKQASEAIFERFPVVFMRRQAYIMPAPTTVNGIKLFLHEGYELVLPSALEGKSLEEIAAIQKENLHRFIPVGQLLAVDAEYLFILEAYLRAEAGSFIKQNFVKVSMDIEKPEFVKQEESEEFVSTNISQKKKRKLKGGET